MEDLALWARERAIPKPRSESGWAELRRQFAMDQARRRYSQQLTQRRVIGGAAASAPATSHDPRTILTDNGATLDLVDRVSPDELDDFHELVEQRNKALHEAKGDDLTRDVLLQRLDHAALTQAAPFARTAPPSAVKAVLGGNATVAIPAVGTSLQSIISAAPQVAAWYGESDAETVPITVTFGPIGNVPYQIGIQNFRPFGIVQFGTRTTMMQVEVDIGIGCQFTISGSQVIVNVALDVPYSGSVSANLALSGMLSFFASQRSFPLTRTRYIDSLAKNTVVFVTPPPFARRLTVFVNSGISISATSGSDNSTTVHLQTSAGSTINEVDIPASTPYQTIELDRQTFQVGILNNSGQYKISYALVFELGL